MGSEGAGKVESALFVRRVPCQPPHIGDSDVSIRGGDALYSRHCYCALDMDKKRIQTSIVLSTYSRAYTSNRRLDNGV
jgi:hypothetical protein